VACAVWPAPLLVTRLSWFLFWLSLRPFHRRGYVDSLLSSLALDHVVAAFHVFYCCIVDVVVAFCFACVAIMGVVETVGETVLQLANIYHCRCGLLVFLWRF
jgi:hypothetical protein